jgi:hypothetical protein
VQTELDLGDRSEWIRVERDPTLCELHNEDVCILCGWPNFRKKSWKLKVSGDRIYLAPKSDISGLARTYPT